MAASLPTFAAASSSRQSTVGSRCKLDTWYRCTARIKRDAFSFTAVERDTRKVVCRSGSIPLDDPGDAVTFDLVDNHDGPAGDTATEWDNLAVAELKPVPDVAAVPPPGLVERLAALVAEHRTIEETFERSVHDAGGGSPAAGGLGKGGVNFRSRQGREDLEQIIADLKANRLPRSFAE